MPATRAAAAASALVVVALCPIAAAGAVPVHAAPAVVAPHVVAPPVVAGRLAGPAALPAQDSPTPTADASATPTPTDTGTTSPSPTQTPTASPTPTDTASPTPTPTATATTGTPSPTPTSTGSPSPAPDEQGDDSLGLPVLLGLAALFALMGIVSWFIMRRSYRRRWDRDLAVEREQASWVLSPLVPTITSRSAAPSLVAEQWATASPTLDQLERNLATLAAGRPDASRGARAQRLADAVHEVRVALAADVLLRESGASLDPSALAASQAAVQRARDNLAGALATTA